ncbi:MAG: M48 family metallopeptidase [Verrucomicrobia bacterium]|nr:M48 family metallopeptidase [Verrucomicrobiota bacterium]
MDFFAKQESARRNTGRLLVLFFIALALIVTAVHLVVSALVPFVLESRQSRIDDPVLIAINIAATLLIVLCGAGITWAGLAGGGSAVAQSCGGRQVDPASLDPLERRLLNVVEEMSIASGVPAPAVFVLEDEDGINAFAAGKTTSDAAVAVTRGALQNLTRDELQGVVGHEFSHILNGDMRLNIRLAGWLGGIMGLAVVGKVLVQLISDSRGHRLSSRRDKGASGILVVLFLLGLALLVIGYLGVFFGRLIQAAVSRQREFLADSSAVQFTRNPLGLAGALKKIAGFRHGSVLSTPQASLLRHLFFSNAARPSWLDALMASHPPINERIQWLDPAFNAEMAKLAAEPRPVSSEDSARPVAGLASGPAAFKMDRRAIANFPLAVGDARSTDLKHAADFVRALPDAITVAARDPHGSRALVFALLLSEEPAVRAGQIARLREQSDAPVCDDLARLEPLPELRDRARKLALLDLALTGLRRMNRSQFERFNSILDELIASDGWLDLFEFTLKRVLARHLGIFFGVITPQAARGKLLTFRRECMVLLSCLARQGHRGDPTMAAAAYRAGWRELLLSNPSDEPLPQDECKLDALGSALDALGAAAFPMKKRILTACVAVISADGSVRVEEAELLRAISNSLDCPVPPAGIR